MRRSDLIVVACLALVFWPQLQGMVPPDVVKVDPVPAPTNELQTLVAPVTAALDKAGGPTVAVFYRQFAEIVGRDKVVLTSTGQFWVFHRRAAKLMFKDGPFKGKYPELDKAISDAITRHVGLDDVPMDESTKRTVQSSSEWQVVRTSPPKRGQIVDILNAVAWAAGEAG